MYYKKSEHFDDNVIVYVEREVVVFLKEKLCLEFLHSCPRAIHQAILHLTLSRKATKELLPVSSTLNNS